MILKLSFFNLKINFINRTVPVYFIWLKYLSWLGYGNEILVINQWDNIRNITCDREPCISNGTQIISYLNMKQVVKFSFGSKMTICKT